MKRITTYRVIGENYAKGGKQIVQQGLTLTQANFLSSQLILMGVQNVKTEKEKYNI